jgi:hypothetical protein
MQFRAYTFVETRRGTRRIEPLPPSPMRSEQLRGAVPTGRRQTRVSLQSSTNWCRSWTVAFAQKAAQSKGALWRTKAARLTGFTP